MRTPPLPFPHPITAPHAQGAPDYRFPKGCGQTGFHGFPRVPHSHGIAWTDPGFHAGFLISPQKTLLSRLGMVVREYL